MNEKLYSYEIKDYCSPFYEFPKLKNFIENALLIYDVLISNSNLDIQDISQKINAELQVVLKYVYFNL